MPRTKLQVPSAKDQSPRSKQQGTRKERKGIEADRILDVKLRESGTKELDFYPWNLILGF
jgi:hypothetical protein